MVIARERARFTMFFDFDFGSFQNTRIASVQHPRFVNIQTC
jgi:hypothetical protein